MAQLQRYSLNDTKNPALTLGRTRKFISPPSGGGGVDETPPRSL